MKWATADERVMVAIVIPSRHVERIEEEKRCSQSKLTPPVELRAEEKNPDAYSRRENGTVFGEESKKRRGWGMSSFHCRIFIAAETIDI